MAILLDLIEKHIESLLNSGEERTQQCCAYKWTTKCKKTYTSGANIS